MARITIEECWWTDPRRSALIRALGSETLADGCAIRAWRLAQEFWKQGRKLIPADLFEALEGAAELIRTKLADVRERSVYVRGSSAYLDWVREQREIAREAGKKSAEVRRKKTGSAQPKPRTTPERTPNATRTESNDAEPSVSVSVSVSGSDSGSGSEISKAAAKPNAGAFIGAYCSAWKARYKSRPEITGKEQGIARRLLDHIPQERALALVGGFLQMETQWFLTKRHDLATFEQNLNAVVQFLDTGQQVTQEEARNAESSAYYDSQLSRIARGEL